jgi:hypothetical protein
LSYTYALTQQHVRLDGITAADGSWDKWVLTDLRLTLCTCFNCKHSWDPNM